MLAFVGAKSSTKFENIRIYNNEGQESVIDETILSLNDNGEIEDSFSAGYTWYFNEDSTYNEIKYVKDGQEISRAITITNAKAGMVYYVSLN